MIKVNICSFILAIGLLLFSCDSSPVVIDESHEKSFTVTTKGTLVYSIWDEAIFFVNENREKTRFDLSNQIKINPGWYNWENLPNQQYQMSNHDGYKSLLSLAVSIPISVDSILVIPSFPNDSGEFKLSFQQQIPKQDLLKTQLIWEERFNIEK